jgi:hypothetical protein
MMARTMTAKTMARRQGRQVRIVRMTGKGDDDVKDDVSEDDSDDGKDDRQGRQQRQ